MKPSKPGSGKSSQSGPARNRNAAASRLSQHKSVSGWPGGVKRSADVLVSVVALVVLTPLLILIAAAVSLADRGPILYRQKRIGLGGRRFTIIKFRTMREDAERDLGAIWSVPDDPRCTRIGHYLRRFGLDELPQLWNVLRGQMSLVGPRPAALGQLVDYTPEERRVRASVLPGITGLAQVNGRSDLALAEATRFDLWYIEHSSVALDVEILLKTIRVTLLSKGTN